MCVSFKYILTKHLLTLTFNVIINMGNMENENKCDSNEVSTDVIFQTLFIKLHCIRLFLYACIYTPELSAY